LRTNHRGLQAGGLDPDHETRGDQDHRQDPDLVLAPRNDAAPKKAATGTVNGARVRAPRVVEAHHHPVAVKDHHLPLRKDERHRPRSTKDVVVCHRNEEVILLLKEEGMGTAGGMMPPQDQGRQDPGLVLAPRNDAAPKKAATEIVNGARVKAPRVVEAHHHQVVKDPLLPLRKDERHRPRSTKDEVVSHLQDEVILLLKEEGTATAGGMMPPQGQDLEAQEAEAETRPHHVEDALKQQP